MQLFSIGIEKRNLPLRELIARKNGIINPEGFKVQEKDAGEMVFFNYIATNECNGDICDRVKKKKNNIDFSMIVTEVIIEYMRTEMIRKIIEDEYFYLKKEEKDRVFKDAVSFMEIGTTIEDITGTPGPQKFFKQWRDRVQKRVAEYLNENSELIIEGFIRFRLKDFIAELEFAVDKAVDDLLIQKEYDDFIKLLKYFVEIQEPKIDEVHVMPGENKKYTLLDSSLKVINNEILEDLAQEISDDDFNGDDLLISSLITIAPNKITIHECYKIENSELLNTINSVFDGRVVFSNEGISPKKKGN